MSCRGGGGGGSVDESSMSQPLLKRVDCSVYLTEVSGGDRKSVV